MSEIQKELQEVLRAHQKGAQIQRHLDQLNVQLKEAYEDLDSLEKQLEKEFRDIEKLEKLSLKGLFHQVLGSKEEQIEKERQDYLQVSLKFDEAKKSVDLLEYERSVLEKKVINLEVLQKRLEKLLSMREEELIRGQTRLGNQILVILDKKDELNAYTSNLKHVKKNGAASIALLDRMIGYLQRARNWGQWDMTGRRGGSSYMKHDAIDKAKDLSYQVKHILVRFKEDLRHIYGPASIDLSIHFASFNRFTDVFFDNLISDWIIQQKIQNALSNVQSVRDRVLRIMQSLDADVQKSQEEIQALEQKRRDLVLSS